MFPVVTSSFNKKQLVEQMGAMRTWLDHNRVEPVNFSSTGGPDGFSVHIDFRTEAQADAFALAFGGGQVRLAA